MNMDKGDYRSVMDLKKQQIQLMVFYIIMILVVICRQFLNAVYELITIDINITLNIP